MSLTLLVFLAVLAVACLAGILWYTRIVLESAEILRSQGWVCVGWSFLGGPIMVPPPPQQNGPEGPFAIR